MDETMAADIERMKAEYRKRNGLPEDAPVVAVAGEGRIYFGHDDGSFRHYDGGALDLGIIRETGPIHGLLRRAWWWLRWGWRR